MKLQSDISFEPATKFWIYNLKTANYNEYVKSKSNYITFFGEYSISKNDIIILFQKDRRGSGFIGILQATQDLDMNNNGITIFKNENLNKYYVKLKYKKLFSNLIKIDEVLSSLKIPKNDNTGYKNASSFRSRFLKNDNTAVQMTIFGKKILEKLIELSNKTNNELIQSQKSISDESLQKSEEKIDKPKKPTIEPIKEYNKVIKLKPDSEDENSDDSDIFYKNDDNSEDDNDEDEEESDEGDPNGYIPIMVIPCEEFSIPKKDKVEYFIEHYKKCNNCDITNNNNKELCSIIDNSTVEFFELKNEKHGYFNPALDSYFKLKKYQPMSVNEYPFIRVIYIKNYHDIYHGCILIAWCDEQKN
jgi:hypothetical protein